MSKKLSLREALGRPADTKVESPARSGSRVRLILRAAGDIARPVDVARLLVDYGLTLRKAHDVIRRLSAGEKVALELWPEDPTSVAGQLRELGVGAIVLREVTADVAKVRSNFGLSQAEFAHRFGFELDSIRNWEQGRYTPDGPVQLLLGIIERHPDIVEMVLSTPPAPSLFDMAAKITMTGRYTAAQEPWRGTYRMDDIH